MTDNMPVYAVIQPSSPPALSAVCAMCQHLPNAAVRKCAAFPSEIPSEIWLGHVTHTRPFPNDNNIQFEQMENTDD